MSERINPIRDELIDAKRYNEVILKITNKIASLRDEVLYPVDENNDSRVSGKQIKNGLGLIRSIIRSSDPARTISDIAADEKDIKSISDTLTMIRNGNKMNLHNYAIVLSHRDKTFPTTMENIRIGLVLEMVADAILTAVTECNETGDPESVIRGLDSASIPKGWKKMDTDDITVEECLIETPSRSDIIDDIIRQLQALKDMSIELGVPVITALQTRDDV